MKKWLAGLLCVVLVMGLTACGEEEITDTTESATTTTTTTAKDTDTQWAMYWYLCGSDLETYNGAATTDLLELLEVQLPENVQVVIQTGGATAWQNELINPDKAQRYLYDSEGLVLIEEFDAVNMGDAQTLADFLSFANENYPAERTMVNFWNHGGGSVTGAAFDEQFGMDSLSLNEMYEAFSAVFPLDMDNQPIDIVGFDTCLMATIDVAYTFCDVAKYLVASQELEPGNGWLYSGVVGAMAENPAIEPVDLGIVICDTFVEGCEQVGTQDSITLSVTDLSNVWDLIEAYDVFGADALAYAAEDTGFFTQFSKIASQSENYGGNTREQGYTNMVDLGSLAALSVDIFPESASAVLDALEACVVYKINSKYRTDAQGLSCYYSYDGSIDDLNGYMDVGASNAFKSFYAYGLTGELPEDGMAYLDEMEYEVLPTVQNIYQMGWEDMPLTINDEGCATITLGAEGYDVLASIAFELYYVDLEENVMLSLGIDNDMTGDWDICQFSDNFRGVWGALDGVLCYMELVYEGEDYNEYAVPILLNGEDYILTVYYDFVWEEFYIDGARKPVDAYGAADKNMRYLEVGDEIQPIAYGCSLDDVSDDLIAVPLDVVVVSQDLTFEEIELGDGLFMMMFRMSDYQNNMVYSDIATFEIIDGDIYTSVD